MDLWRGNRRSGVSLIELLSVIVIILILAGMLLGPVLRAYHKAKSFAGEMEGPSVVELAVERLRRFHQSHLTYGFLTADYLHKQAIFDSKFMQYLREKKVSYYAFSSADPDDRIIVSYTFSRDSTNFIVKSQITSTPLNR